MTNNPKAFDFGNLRRIPLGQRASLANLSQMARTHQPGDTLKNFFEKLPDHLAARDLKSLAQAIVSARQKGCPVMLGMGAHPVKVGLSPIIIDLIRRNIITSLAVNGAVLVHDYETAVGGSTSEDVDEALDDGSFGVTLETGRDLAHFVDEGAKNALGLGEAVARGIVRMKPECVEYSLLAACHETKTPLTAHVAIGTDVTHLAPELNFARLGETAGRDFARFISLVGELEGGVYLNLGSAVILPEVFLKAVSAARNAGSKLADITTANMDFFRHYRPLTNVVARPTKSGGRGYHLTGHHEIMFPLLAAIVLEGFS
jgi:hypothetical protein